MTSKQKPVVHDPDAAEAALRTFIEAWEPMSLTSVQEAMRRVGAAKSRSWFKDMLYLADDLR